MLPILCGHQRSCHAWRGGLARDLPPGRRVAAIWQRRLAARRVGDMRETMKTRKAKPLTYHEVQDNRAMAQRVEEGLPVSEVVQFGKQAGFSTYELARLIRIPPRTYARR